MTSKQFIRSGAYVERMVILVILWSVASPSHAHLMVEQHGTLNFTDRGAYFVLSIPVTAFENVDNNDDRKLSGDELGQHVSTIKRQIQSHVQLYNDAGEQFPLEGLMLSIEPPDEDPHAPAAYLVALGRFTIDASELSPVLRISFIGDNPNKQIFRIKATRGTVSRTLTFRPGSDRQPLFN
ncbi:MAG: hypothetical protein HKN70_09315, partial [Gammaproteobacteria bacterium]|nr:hypothetical protein [Gammaproteobacteria bacterium]